MLSRALLSIAAILFLAICASEASTPSFPRRFIQSSSPKTLPWSTFETYSIDAKEFYSSIARVEKEFTQDFRNRRRTAVFHADWNDPTVNAETRLIGQEAHFYLFGGLARHPLITRDVFEMILCHEIGHHIGGSPKEKWVTGQNKWASVEGQADYFSTLKCLRRLWKNDETRETTTLGLPKITVRQCEVAHAQTPERLLCKRMAVAGVRFLELIATEDGTPVPKLDTPSVEVVNSTLETYPDNQCRLDTLIAGALCNSPADLPVSDLDPDIGACSTGKLPLPGGRPRCWFAPESLAFFDKAEAS